MNILVVSRSFYRVGDLQELLPHHTVVGCFRDYHLEHMLQQGYDLVLSDGTCKSRGDTDDGKSYPIWFDPKPAAAKLGITVHSLSWFERRARIARWFRQHFYNMHPRTL